MKNNKKQIETHWNRRLHDVRATIARLVATIAPLFVFARIHAGSYKLAITGRRRVKPTRVKVEQIPAIRFINHQFRLKISKHQTQIVIALRTTRHIIVDPIHFAIPRHATHRFLIVIIIIIICFIHQTHFTRPNLIFTIRFIYFLNSI